ncbi:F0F1 ATP synthase subunit A [Arcticibacterium luteifluviistationis]|uniref:ATP synthase subunit a n=1 Tax=Arcticibacterium luteifluviistationis TaxID=1784714 RepID=A0A2Z4G6L9_9BACT|nr:F0F1 ATP synthase subunit A [Arcticibacterium luteifluviistationis]AWV96792.1 F0F1 ATP synthase subunit A [Arcticibacterium luteifluviistationis]
MNLSPDETIFWQYGFFIINLTIVTTWAIMLVLVTASFLITRNLKTGIRISRWQCILEIIVEGINNQMEEIGLKNPRYYIGFVGTLFLFIVVSNVLIILPWYEPPTGSLSTTTSLAICVFLAVPYFGISQTGLGGYLKTYIKPTFIMLPFNLISEITRTLALAVRLFGNMMSGGLIIAILLSITPFLFPVIMKVLGLLTGVVQAYIFSILATVYIAAAVQGSVKENK